MAIEIRYDPKRVVNLNNLWMLKMPLAAEAAKSLQEFGSTMRGIQWQQTMGRTLRNTYMINRYSYQSQPAELRRATQLEF